MSGRGPHVKTRSRTFHEKGVGLAAIVAERVMAKNTKGKRTSVLLPCLDDEEAA
jgi:hypothetical protein